MKRMLRPVAAACFAIALTTPFAWAGSEKLSSELRPENTTGRRSAQSSPSQNVDVIVQYKVALTESHHQRVAALGGKLRAKMDFIRSAHYTVPVAALATLADDPDVAYISPNRPVKAMFDQITNGTVGSTTANSLLQSGAAVGVAVIDSGVSALPDFQGGLLNLYDRITYQRSFVGGTAADQYGHGTHVAGILAGNGNGTVYSGVGPQINIISLRVLDANGMGTDAGVIRPSMPPSR